jgi:hypothetical protein
VCGRVVVGVSVCVRVYNMGDDFATSICESESVCACARAYIHTYTGVTINQHDFLT